MQKEYLASAEEVLEEQSSNPETGLAASTAQERLARYGLNKLDEEEKTPLWIRFFQQMADPMVIMLIVAAVISAVTGMIQGESEWADVIIIMTVVIINSALGVIQEAKSEEALAALQEMSAAQSKVIRDGKMTMLHSSELVPGDIVLLEAGDSVPADCRVLESASMKIEEAALTGESVPVEKHADVIALDPGVDDVPLGDRKNMCYMGSTVVYGRGRAVVVGTGMKTEMGKIAGALNEAKEELTPLQMKLAELSRILTIMVIVICVVIFAVDLLRSGIGNVMAEPHMLLDTFMVAVSLAVAAIPEGLVAVVTIVLSIGVTKMAKRQAIIRNLSAVETLGCTQVICSDKTGTLTQNKMTVVKHELASSEEKLLAGMALCSDAKWDEQAGEAVGEPTECALVNDAGRAGMQGLDVEHPRVGEAPFDSGRKMMSVVVEEADGSFEQYTKGAPDVILNLCTQVYEDGKIVPMTDAKRDELLAANKAMADEALRVLALASRTYDTKPTDFSAEALENNLVLLRSVRHDRPRASRGGPRHQGGARRRHPHRHDHGRPHRHRRGHRQEPRYRRGSRPGNHRRRDRQDVRRGTRPSDREVRRVRPRPARAQDAYRRGVEVQEQGRRHDRRRRERRPVHQARRHRRGHGHHRHRRHQERRRHGPCRRQLRHHRRCVRRGPPHLRQHPQGHPVPAVREPGRGLLGVRRHAHGLHPVPAHPAAVGQPRSPTASRRSRSAWRRPRATS